MKALPPDIDISVFTVIVNIKVVLAGNERIRHTPKLSRKAVLDSPALVFVQMKVKLLPLP